MRFIHAMRYRRAGLQRVLAEIAPDVFHAHYAVEHGFFGATAGFHPYVISCWGSDVFVESQKLISGQIARYALRKADFVTAADPEMSRQLRRLGVKAEDLAVVPLGLTQDFLPPPEASANLQPPLSSLSVISDRALEPVYNVDRVIRAFAIVKKKLPHLFLTIANHGSEAPELQQLATELGLRDSVHFTGSVSQEVLRQYLMSANVYVSVPSSDSFALSNLEAMSCGAFPILSNLPSAEGWIEPGRTGYLTIDDTVESLAGQMYDSLIRHDLRRDAVAPNRLKVEEHGMLETNMLAMEQIYYRLAAAGDSAG
jgi:glycosyltransferase involved in cell wall biosynthesis